MAAAIGLAFILTFPVVTQMGSGARLDSADGQFSVWSVAWVARTLTTDPLHLFDANIFHPYRNALAFAENNIGPGVLAIPGYWLTGSPYVAHNSVLLLAFVLSFLGMFYLVRHLTGSARAAVVPAIAFAYCPYVFARIPHIHLLLTGGIPFALLALHRLVDRPTVPRALVLGLVLGAVALSSGYYGIFAGLTVGLGVLFYAGSRGLWRTPRFWALCVGAGVLSVMMVLPFLLPYLALQRDTGFERVLSNADQFSADWRAYLASPAYAHRWMLAWLVTWQDVLFPGFVATGFGIAGLWLGLRSPRSVAQRETTIFYGLLGAMAFWASFGPRAGLYAALYYVVPVLSLIRASSRFGVIVTLALAVLTGLAIQRLLSHRTIVSQGRWVAALALITVLESTSIPIRWVTAPPRFAAYEMLAALPRTAVAEFPFFARRDDFPKHTYYMLNSTRHWQPLLNGYSNYIPPEFRWMVAHMETFPARRPFEILVERDVRYVVFHLALYNDRSREDVLEKIGRYQSFLRPLVQEEDVWLFEIVNWPPAPDPRPLVPDPGPPLPDPRSLTPVPDPHP